MGNLILMSIVLAHAVVPVLAARAGNARRAFMSMIVLLLIVDLMYVLALSSGYTRFFVPPPAS